MFEKNDNKLKNTETIFLVITVIFTVLDIISITAITIITSDYLYLLMFIPLFLLLWLIWTLFYFLVSIALDVKVMRNKLFHIKNPSLLYAVSETETVETSDTTDENLSKF